MEPLPPPCSPGLPDPATLDDEALGRLIFEETRMNVGFDPHPWQVRIVIAVVQRHDALCWAETGFGKTLSFVTALFVQPKMVIWMVFPLNYSEEQQAKTFQEWGISDILAGRYQVVISSPESFRRLNKLHPIVISDELQLWFQVTVIEEAHCVHTWRKQFRVAYNRCSDMRGSMHSGAISGCNGDLYGDREYINGSVIHARQLTGREPWKSHGECRAWGVRDVWRLEVLRRDAAPENAMVLTQHYERVRRDQPMWARAITMVAPDQLPKAKKICEKVALQAPDLEEAAEAAVKLEGEEPDRQNPFRDAIPEEIEAVSKADDESDEGDVEPTQTPAQPQPAIAESHSRPSKP
ncbi:hypothetical protein FRC09_009493 [Ceratobasidium sp. 395]|nr:hypothetical protein FRC09_009493 [Ceratobasidium sp. 395]